MKVTLFSMILSAFSFGTTRLEFKLEGYYFPQKNKMTKVNVPALNKQLKKLGLDGLPEIITVGENPEAYWRVLKDRIEAANKALDREMHFNFDHDGHGNGYFYQHAWCYRGDITGIPDRIQTMLRNFLEEEQGILAIGAGSKKVIYDDSFKSREGLKRRFEGEYQTNIENINKWLNYKKSSDTALVMSDYGPQGDGTELEATNVPPCK